MRLDPLLRAAGRLGGYRIAAALARRQPLVVLIHGVSARDTFDGIENYRGKHLPLAAFRTALAYLVRHFSIVPLAEVERLVLERREPPRPTCAVTFDDGYRNNYQNAFPLLRERGIPATFFVTTGFVDRREPLWVDRLEYALNSGNGSVAEQYARDAALRARLKSMPITQRNAVLTELVVQSGRDLSSVLDRHPDYQPLSWDEIREMSRAGVAIGVHTVNHPILLRETADEQRREIVESRDRIIAEVGECRHFAYPDGQPGTWNDASVTALKESGFTAAWTTEMRRVRPRGEPDAYALPRVALDAVHASGRFESLASNLLPALKRLAGRS